METSVARFKPLLVRLDVESGFSSSSSSRCSMFVKLFPSPAGSLHAPKKIIITNLRSGGGRGGGGGGQQNVSQQAEEKKKKSKNFQGN